MKIKDIIPGNAVSSYVKCFRIVHIIPTREIPSFSKYYVPKPEMVLHSNVRGSQLVMPSVGAEKALSYRCFVSGQQVQPFIFNCQGELLNFQIVFKPTSIYKLTGIPTNELANTFIDAQLVFGNPIRAYIEQLEAADSVEAMVKVGESFILQLIEKSKISELRIDEVFRNRLPYSSSVTVNKLAKENNLCEKQFKRKFIEAIGVNPKTYLNIIRFHKAYNIKNANPDWDWLRIAVESGYYDYQHLAKEYLLFTNHTPVQYHQHIEPNSPEMLLGVARQIYRHRFKELALF